MAENQVKDIKEFLSTPEKPIPTSEMMEFWKSLSPEEKEYYKTADLSVV